MQTLANTCCMPFFGFAQTSPHLPASFCLPSCVWTDMNIYFIPILCCAKTDRLSHSLSSNLYGMVATVALCCRLGLTFLSLLQLSSYMISRTPTTQLALHALLPCTFCLAYTATFPLPHTTYTPSSFVCRLTDWTGGQENIGTPHVPSVLSA